jgi:hypothetical protein
MGIHHQNEKILSLRSHLSKMWTAIPSITRIPKISAILKGFILNDGQMSRIDPTQPLEDNFKVKQA